MAESRLDRLRKHADDLEFEMTQTKGMGYAALSGRYLDVLAQIEEIERRAPVADSPVDEIAARRKARRRPLKNGEAREA